MYQEILKKKELLDSRKPYIPEIRKQIKKDEWCALIYTCMRLDGSVMSKAHINSILEDDFVPEGTVQDHLAIESYIEVLILMENLIGMDSDISLKVIDDIHDISCAGEGRIWRHSNPVLFTLDYNPPHWQDVKELMNTFIRWYYKAHEETAGNEILKAAYIHNKLIEIYPFARNNESTARLIMYYSLLKAGYPIFELRLSEQEYNTAVMQYVRHKKIEPFYEALERSIYNKIQVLIQMTENDGE